MKLNYECLDRLCDNVDQKNDIIDKAVNYYVQDFEFKFERLDNNNNSNSSNSMDNDNYNIMEDIFIQKKEGSYVSNEIMDKSL